MFIMMLNGCNWGKKLVNHVVTPEAKVGLIGHFKDDSSSLFTAFS